MIMDDRVLAGALARGIVDKSAKENRTGQLLPATVLSYGESVGFAGTFAVVHLVGDPPDRQLQIPALTTGELHAGDMVMVLFDPPEGAYVWCAIAGRVRVFTWSAGVTENGGG